VCASFARFGLFGLFVGNVAYRRLHFGHSSMFAWRYGKFGLISIQVQCMSTAVLIACWPLTHTPTLFSKKNNLLQISIWRSCWEDRLQSDLVSVDSINHLVSRSVCAFIITLIAVSIKKQRSGVRPSVCLSLCPTLRILKLTRGQRVMWPAFTFQQHYLLMTTLEGPETVLCIIDLWSPEITMWPGQ